MNDAGEAKRLWSQSARAWIGLIHRGDVNRTEVLDPAMLALTEVLDPAMLALAEGIEGRLVLDVGCGEGRFCRMLAQSGAHTTGIDPTPELIEEARRQDPAGNYLVADGERLPFEDRSFDLAVAYLSLIDIPDFRASIREMARVLRPGGALLVANTQPYASTRPTFWYRDADGKKLHGAVEDYFEERMTRLTWADISIVNWHRPLEAYMTALIEAGLRLTHFREPRPTLEAVARHPALLDEYRIPIFHAMRWVKE